VPEQRQPQRFYLVSVRTLGAGRSRRPGLNVRLGSLDRDPAAAPHRAAAARWRRARARAAAARQRGRLGLKDFDPCTILLNYGLHGGVPDRMLEDLHEQYLLPPLHAGWTVRRKSRHFQSYEEVAKRFAKLLGMDPWLINPMFANARPQLDLAADEGVEPLRGHVEAAADQGGASTRSTASTRSPSCVVKAGDGSHGHRRASRCATPRDLDEALRKARAEAAAAGRPAPRLAEIIVQEGVPTYERINDAVAEPVVVHDRPLRGGRLLPRARRAWASTRT
jgi:glutamate--cysteine ligase